MTRANINFRYFNEKEKRFETIYCYHNGDQYPMGLVKFYNIMELFKDENGISKDNFISWLTKNYSEDIKYIKTLATPCIYYDDCSMITDWSYVFEEEGLVLVYEWDKLVFKGDVSEAIEWFNKQK